MAYFRPFFSGLPQHPFMTDPMMDGHFRQLARRNEPALMSPFGMMDPFTHMQSMMANFHNMPDANPSLSNNGHCYSQSTVMQFSSSTGCDGQPKVYQSSSSVRCAPGGIKEARKMERDSTSGVQKVSVSHQIGDRSHTVQKKVNVRTNEKEENHELINITEDDEHSFNKEWDTKTESFPHQIGGRSHTETRRPPSLMSSAHRESSLVDKSPPLHPRVHPYTRSEGVEGRRKRRGRVEFS